MPTTTRGALPYPDSTDNWKQLRAQLQALAVQVASVAALYSHTDPRPAAGTPGRLHRHPTTGVVSYDTGAAWVQLLTPTTGKAADADLLDGLDSSAFLRTTGKAADADKLDGLDSTVFARRDQGVTFAGTLDTSSGGQVREGGQRVYSPNNPPPASGAMIVQTIRGVISVAIGVGGASTNQGATTVSIPAVNLGKSQLRFLGATGSSGVGDARVRMVSSTAVEAYAAVSSGGGQTFSVAYEITEWS